MATDPLDVLRAPIVTEEPRREFVSELLRDLRRELAPYLVARHLVTDAIDWSERSVDPDPGSEEETMTSTTTSPVTAGVRYDDAPAGIEWLTTVLGFRVDERHDGAGGSVMHARLSWHGGQVFVSTRVPADTIWRTGPVSIALNTPDPTEVDARYEVARAAGVELTEELHDAPYGSHQFSLRDPEGNLWTVGTYLPPIAST